MQNPVLLVLWGNKNPNQTKETKTNNPNQEAFKELWMNLDLNSLWFFILVIKQNLGLPRGVICQGALWVLSETPW